MAEQPACSHLAQKAIFSGQYAESSHAESIWKSLGMVSKGSTRTPPFARDVLGKTLHHDRPGAVSRSLESMSADASRRHSRLFRGMRRVAGRFSCHHGFGDSQFGPATRPAPVRFFRGTSGTNGEGRRSSEGLQRRSSLRCATLRRPMQGRLGGCPGASAWPPGIRAFPSALPCRLVPKHPAGRRRKTRPHRPPSVGRRLVRIDAALSGTPLPQAFAGRSDYHGRLLGLGRLPHSHRRVSSGESHQRSNSAD